MRPNKRVKGCVAVLWGCKAWTCKCTRPSAKFGETFRRNMANVALLMAVADHQAQNYEVLQRIRLGFLMNPIFEVDYVCGFNESERRGCHS